MVKVAVLGSSGNIGSAVVKTLGTKYPDVDVVAGVRNPDAEKASQLDASENVEKIVADLGRPETLNDAIKGADVVFINTPGAENRVELVVNGIQAAKDAGVDHIVVVSGITAGDHGTIFGKHFGEIETRVQNSGLKYTVLRLPFFIDNLWMHRDSIRQQSRIYSPLRPDTLFTPIAVQDVGEAAALILKDPNSHVNKTYIFSTRPCTMADTAQAFSAGLGRKIEYEQVSYDDAKKSLMDIGMPEWQAIGVLELFHFMDDNSKLTNNYTEDFKKITGRDPTTVDQWASHVSGAFM